MKWSEWSEGPSSLERLVWVYSGAVIPFPALIIALFVIPGESLPLLCPIQSEVNLGEYFSGASGHLGEKELHTILWTIMGCTGLQEPILFGEKQVSKLRYSSAHDYVSLRLVHVFLNVELSPFTLSFKHLLE